MTIKATNDYNKDTANFDTAMKPIYVIPTRNSPQVDVSLVWIECPVNAKIRYGDTIEKRESSVPCADITAPANAQKSPGPLHYREVITYSALQRGSEDADDLYGEELMTH